MESVFVDVAAADVDADAGVDADDAIGGVATGVVVCAVALVGVAPAPAIST